MKELSIEEKANRYDEAIGKLRGMMPYWENLSYNGKTFLQDLVYFFPELKESEDEIIRKQIKAFIKSRGSQITQSKTDAGIAWLEKQGEQNPAWSEEDEEKLDRIISIIHCYTGTVQEENELKSWLETLKDRVQPQNLIVTDEELAQAKKNAYNDALDKIEYHSGEPTFDDGWSAAICYLKKRNAQPQNTWKPSDEQMITLRQVISGCSYDIEPLAEIEEQLKKLRKDNYEQSRFNDR